MTTATNSPSPNEVPNEAPEPTKPAAFRGMVRTLEDYSGWRLPFHGLGRKLSFWALNAKFKLSVSGRENMPDPDDVQFMVASNHLSNWDPVFLGNLIPKRYVAFIAKRELVEIHPIVNFIMDGLGIITIDRENVSVSSIRSAKTIATHPKWILGIFPEGTRKKAGDTNTNNDTTDDSGGKRGAAFLAKATKSPVLPVGIRYNQDTKRCHAHIGQLVPINHDVDAMSADIMAAIRACEGECEKQLKI